MSDDIYDWLLRVHKTTVENKMKRQNLNPDVTIDEVDSPTIYSRAAAEIKRLRDKVKSLEDM